MSDIAPAIEAARALGLDFEMTLLGRVSSLKEFTEFLGTESRNITKMLVVRHGEGDFVLSHRPQRPKDLVEEAA